METTPPSYPNQERLTEYVLMEGRRRGFFVKNLPPHLVEEQKALIMRLFETLKTEKMALILKFGMTEDGEMHTEEEIAETMMREVEDETDDNEGGDETEPKMVMKPEHPEDVAVFIRGALRMLTRGGEY